MDRRFVSIDMRETDEWIDHLRSLNRKEGTLQTHRSNVKRCLKFLTAGLRSTYAEDIDDEGGLVVRLPDGSRETIRSGEVSVRGLYGYV